MYNEPLNSNGTFKACALWNFYCSPVNVFAQSKSGYVPMGVLLCTSLFFIHYHNITFFRIKVRARSHLATATQIFDVVSMSSNNKHELFCSEVNRVAVESKGPFTLGDNDVFSCRHVWTVTLMTMKPISDDMVTTSKICVVVAKCERALMYLNHLCFILSSSPAWQTRWRLPIIIPQKKLPCRSICGMHANYCMSQNCYNLVLSQGYPPSFRNKELKEHDVPFLFKLFTKGKSHCHRHRNVTVSNWALISISLWRALLEKSRFSEGNVPRWTCVISRDSILSLT